jgi:hypothetical protein
VTLPNLVRTEKKGVVQTRHAVWARTTTVHEGVPLAGGGWVEAGATSSDDVVNLCVFPDGSFQATKN